MSFESNLPKKNAKKEERILTGEVLPPLKEGKEDNVDYKLRCAQAEGMLLGLLSGFHDLDKSGRPNKYFGFKIKSKAGELLQHQLIDLLKALKGK